MMFNFSDFRNRKFFYFNQGDEYYIVYADHVAFFVVDVVTSETAAYFRTSKFNALNVSVVKLDVKVSLTDPAHVFYESFGLMQNDNLHQGAILGKNSIPKIVDQLRAMIGLPA